MHAKYTLSLMRTINKCSTQDHMSNYKASPCSFTNTTRLYAAIINDTMFIVTLTVVQQNNHLLHGSPHTFKLTQKLVVLT